MIKASSTKGGVSCCKCKEVIPCTTARNVKTGKHTCFSCNRRQTQTGDRGFIDWLLNQLK